MPHVIINVRQTGRLLGGQTGEGFLEATRYQRGFGYSRHRQVGLGVGALLSTAWNKLVPYAKKHILPIVKDALGAIGEEAATAGSNIYKGISSGENIKETIETHGKQALKNLAKRAGATLTQAGSGPKKKSIRSLANLHLVGRSVLSSSAQKRRRNQKAISGLF
jgi:hypothetical protein